MDSTLYEIFVPPNVTENFKTLYFIITDEFQRSNVDYDYIDDITFHLYPSDNSYFYFGNSDTTHVAFENYYDLYLPSIIENCSLSSATSDPIPLDDYELQVAVSSGGKEIIKEEIIIHVVSSVPTSPSAPGKDNSSLYVSIYMVVGGVNYSCICIKIKDQTVTVLWSCLYSN